MSNLDHQTFRDIVHLLIPHCADPASRKTLLDSALLNCSVLHQIDWTGSARDFTARIVRQLLTYGECETQKPAMVMLLSELREQVGLGGQSQIDILIGKIPLKTPVEADEAWHVPDATMGKHVFISYSRNNLDMVRQITTDLLNAGVNIWIDQVGLKPGTPDWEQALRDAIHDAEAVLYMASPTARRSPYVRDELAIADMEQVPVYPLWVEGEHWMDCVPMGRGYVQFIDVRDTAYKSGVQQVANALAGKVVKFDTEETPAISESQPTDTSKPPRNPYKGLRAFRAEDEADFFGRDTLIQELIETLGTGTKVPRLLAVLGASGSGKSSLVMAGLLPRLKKGVIEGSEKWLYLDPIVPGTHPVESLTIVLARYVKEKSQTAIREDLMNRNKRGLYALTRELADKPVVLYIDQFEELFTLVNDEAERRQFIDLLTTAITEPNGVLIVILSMRADFYDRPMQYTEFGKVIEVYHVAVTPMSLADLYDVVQKPAQGVGLTFDDKLVTDMVFAVREEASALPLLQFTLDQLFEKRASHKLTLDAYNDIGGVQGALAQHAETTFQSLPSEQHKLMARSLFLRLIDAGATEQDTTRRRAMTSELTLPDTETTRILQETANTFIDARLLVSDKYENDRMIEVSHEALIREWKRLGEWLHEARDDLRLQKAISADVAEWKRRGKPLDMLYRGTVLEDALSWVSRNTSSQDEQIFLKAAQKEQEKRIHKEFEKQQNLIEFQERALARFKLALALAVPYLITFILGSVGMIVYIGIRTSTSFAGLPQVGDVSSVSIGAPSNITFQSEILTDRHKQQARNAVAPVFYPPDPNIARQQTQLAQQILDYMENVRADSYSSDEQRVRDLSAISTLVLSEETSIDILIFDVETWNAIAEEVLNILSRMMRLEIRPSEEDNIRLRLNLQVSPRFSTREQNVIVDIVDDLIVANTFESVEATTVAREEAASRVEPQARVLIAGQLVIREGEIIDELDIETLEALHIDGIFAVVDWSSVTNKTMMGVGGLIILILGTIQRIIPHRIRKIHFILSVLILLIIWGLGRIAISTFILNSSV